MSSINQQVADRLREGADLLEQQRADGFRVRAYRGAADAIARLGRDLTDLYEQEGREGLLALPGVGAGIAGAIEEILRTGRWSQLERLRGMLDAERLFCAVPGVGKVLSRRIHDCLHVDTLEALEVAAHDGRLAAVPGIGLRRAAIIRGALGTMLGRARPRLRAVDEPPVAVLLDVDAEYRRDAAAGRLPRIAPRRFNPDGEAWLPILHTDRGTWHFTAMFSNTARAHEFGRTRDWVVIYFHADHQEEGQRTIVTETHGPLEGSRVVRGREPECHEHFMEERCRRERSAADRGGDREPSPPFTSARR